MGYAVRQLAFQSVALNSWLSILSPQFLGLNPYPLILASQICTSRSSAPTLQRSSAPTLRSGAFDPVLSVQCFRSNTPALSIRRSRSSAPVLKKTQMRGAPVLPAPPNSSGTKSTLQVRAPPRNRQVATPPGYRGNITSPWTENACPAAGRQAQIHRILGLSVH